MAGFFSDIDASWKGRIIKINKDSSHPQAGKTGIFLHSVNGYGVFGLQFKRQDENTFFLVKSEHLDDVQIIGYTYQSAFTGKKEIHCENKPIQYKGFEIYKRFARVGKNPGCYDLVKYGICIGMYTGEKGCKNMADKIVEITGVINPVTEYFTADEISAIKKIKSYVNL